MSVRCVLSDTNWTEGGAEGRVTFGLPVFVAGCVKEVVAGGWGGGT